MTAIIGGLVALAALASELAMLVLLAVSGWDLGDGGLLGIALGVLYPALAVLIWSQWMAPRAGRRLPDPPRLLLQTALFAATATAGIAAGHDGWSILFLGVATGAFALGRITDTLGDAPQAGSGSS